MQRLRLEGVGPRQQPGVGLMATVLEEIARLRVLTWNALSREGLDAGMTTTEVREAATLDEMRLSILKKKFPEVDVETPAGTRG